MKEYADKQNQSRTLDSISHASNQALINVILQHNKDTIQRYASGAEEENETLQSKFDTVQHDIMNKEDLLQDKFLTTQHIAVDNKESLQGKFDSSPNAEQESIQREVKPNNIGLPDNLRTDIKHLSGYSMNNAQVYYNFAQLAQLQAFAYTQGKDIHAALEQEKHLPHKAWHVMQQKQGRVQPSMQLQGVYVKDNEVLEKKADKKDLSSINLDAPVIQCITMLGEFRNAGNGAPAGAQNANLNFTLGNLARIPQLQINDIEGNLHTPITFQTGNAHGSLAITEFSVFVGGAWHELDDICDPTSPNYPLGLQLNRDVNLQIVITVDDTLHNIFPGFHNIIATLVHEITVHLIHIHPWLNNLRSGAYTPAQNRAAWRITGLQGGLTTPNEEHAIFGRGHNRSYNMSVQSCYYALPPAQRPAFRDDVRADMDYHRPWGVPALYPI